MTTIATIHTYSGQPDPQFALDEEQAAELRERLNASTEPTVARAPGAAVQLGYRGVSLRRHDEHPEGGFDFFVSGGVIERSVREVGAVDAGSEIERWLLELAAPVLPDAVLEHALGVVDAYPVYTPGAGEDCPPNVTVDAPPYQPGIWNVPNVQPFNNCYNYANNQITNTFAQPGRASGNQAQQMTCPDVQAAATSDGLVAHPNFSDPLGAGQGWYVALVIWPSVDYHWYRQDDNGCWSHKAGQTAATNLDAAGNIIVDPQTAARGPYTDFCTFMITNRNVVIV